jgi:hypothetical protein
MHEMSGKWMVRIWKAGAAADMSKFWVAANQKPRSSKSGTSSAKKRDANGSQAIRRLNRELAANFTRKDYLLTLKYDEAGLARVGDDYDEADHQAMLFLRRVKRRYAAEKTELRGVVMTSRKCDRTLEAARLHHHVVLSGDLISRRAGEDFYRIAGIPADELWSFGSIDFQQLRKEDDRTGLATYLCRQARCKPNEKRWHATRNMRKPQWQDVELTRESIAEYNRHKPKGFPRLVVSHEGKLVVPPKCATLEEGAYIPAIGSHYIRFLLPEYRERARRGT